MTNAEARSQTREVERFHAIFRSELRWMWTTLRRLGVRKADLEDVTHDVFVQVFKKLDGYDASRPIRPWLFAFAYRAASDYRRLARHREDPDAEIDHMLDRAPMPDERVAEREESELVHAALATLDMDRRAVLVGFEIEGVPMKDLAEAFGIPLNTAYSRLRLAREEFTAAVRRLSKRKGGLP